MHTVWTHLQGLHNWQWSDQVCPDSSCLGLFGLSTYIAEKRTKEIGIRKVLGASVQGISTLLSADFLKLVTVAIVIAVPISLVVMNKWLQGFAYRITLEWWIFVLAGATAIAG